MATINSAIELRTACETDKIALRGVRLDATLIGATVRATLEQTFVNLEDKAIEAIYTFPLPETAAVCGFEVLTGDRVLTAEIEESEAALERYDDAIAGGHGAFLLEQDRPDVFSARVGNLKPGQAAKIRVSYVDQLERVDRSLRVRFPTTIAPRYVSAAGTGDPLQAAIDGDVLNPPHVLAVPYGLEMQVRIKAGAEIEKVSSPTHGVNVARPATAAEDWDFSFAEKLVEMDRDVVLQLDLTRDPAPDVQVAKGPDDAHYLAVSFVPEFDLEDLGDHRPNETVFLLDCSGSMQGESIQQASMALELCLRSLSAADTFNVCRFGSTFDFFAPLPVAYSDDTLRRAISFIRRGADLGGTEIHEPLSRVLSAKPTLGEVRNVIVLTDGQVSNEPAVIELARKWRGTNRLFTFGIGTAASGYLIRNLARATGGAAEFISGSERIEDKVLRTFSRIASPAVTDVSVDWGDVEVQTTGEIPPLFDGDILRVFGRAPGWPPASVTLKCRTAAGPQSWTVAVPPVTSDAGVISLGWARAKIESLEGATGSVTSQAVERQSSSERQLTTLSKKFGILCSRTSFVAVEHRSLEERNAGMPDLRRVPAQIAHGWGGLQSGGATSVCSLLALPAAMSPPARARGGIGSALAEKFSSLGRRKSKMRKSMPAMLNEPSDEALRGIEVEPADNLLRLLALQTAEGWFAEGYREILNDAGVATAEWASEIRRSFPTSFFSNGIEVQERTIGALLVLVAFRRLFADRKAIWRRADAKAARWLSHETGVVAAKIDELADAIGKITV